MRRRGVAKIYHVRLTVAAVLHLQVCHEAMKIAWRRYVSVWGLWYDQVEMDPFAATAPIEENDRVGREPILPRSALRNRHRERVVDAFLQAGKFDRPDTYPPL